MLCETVLQHIDIQPFESALGAEIGVDLSSALDDTVFEEVERALYVLLASQAGPHTRNQVAFSRRFGKLEHHVFSDWCLDDHPEILIVSNIQKDGEPIGVYNAGRYWHTDCPMQAPSRGSLLFAIEVPHDGERAGRYLLRERNRCIRASANAEGQGRTLKGAI